MYKNLRSRKIEKVQVSKTVLGRSAKRKHNLREEKSDFVHSVFAHCCVYCVRVGLPETEPALIKTFVGQKYLSLKGQKYFSLTVLKLDTKR